jgi:hypothetical protein
MILQVSFQHTFRYPANLPIVEMPTKVNETNVLANEDADAIRLNRRAGSSAKL